MPAAAYTPPVWRTTDTPAWRTADGYAVTHTLCRYGSYTGHTWTVTDRNGSVIECCDTEDEARAEIDAQREERERAEG